MNLLTTDDVIAQLILNTDEDYTITTPDGLQKGKMKNKNIFTYMLNPKTKTDTSSMIMMSFGFIYNRSKLSNVNLYMEVYTHYKQQNTIDGERNDLLIERIKKLITEKGGLGIGKMAVVSNTDLKPVDEAYIVTQLRFKNLTKAS